MIRTTRILVNVFCLGIASLAGANTQTVSVVHPGCIIEFGGGWKTHLGGVVVEPGTTPIGHQAYDFCKRRLEGRVVMFFTWTTDNTAAGIVYGDDGLAFAKVIYDRTFDSDIAVELLERGLATVDRQHLPDGCEHYLQIEEEARQRQVGIWEKNSFNRPAEE